MKSAETRAALDGSFLRYCEKREKPGLKPSDLLKPGSAQRRMTKILNGGAEARLEAQNLGSPVHGDVGKAADYRPL